MIAHRKACIDCNEKPAAPGRRVCWRCHHKRWADRHPRRVLYWNINTSARKRGIEFSITYDEFCIFCDVTNYDVLVGKNPDDFTVDRIDPRKGYVFDNLRVLTHAENSRQNSARKRLQTLKRFGYFIPA